MIQKDDLPSCICGKAATVTDRPPAALKPGPPVSENSFYGVGIYVLALALVAIFLPFVVTQVVLMFSTLVLVVLTLGRLVIGHNVACAIRWAILKFFGVLTWSIR